MNGENLQRKKVPASKPANRPLTDSDIAGRERFPGKSEYLWYVRAKLAENVEGAPKLTEERLLQGRKSIERAAASIREDKNATQEHGTQKQQRTKTIHELGGELLEDMKRTARPINSQDPDERLHGVENLFSILKTMNYRSKQRFVGRQIFERLALTDPSALVRREAVSVLGALHEIDSIPVVREALKDPNRAVQKMAGKVLMKLEKTKKAVEASLRNQGKLRNPAVGKISHNVRLKG